MGNLVQAPRWSWTKEHDANIWPQLAVGVVIITRPQTPEFYGHTAPYHHLMRKRPPGVEYLKQPGTGTAGGNLHQVDYIRPHHLFHRVWSLLTTVVTWTKTPLNFMKFWLSLSSRLFLCSPERTFTFVNLDIPQKDLPARTLLRASHLGYLFFLLLECFELPFCGSAH